jgi:hypothetical protein
MESLPARRLGWYNDGSYGYWDPAGPSAVADLMPLDGAAVLKGVNVSFFTHNDDKDGDTKVVAELDNKIGIWFSEVLASTPGDDLSAGVGFGDNPPSTHAYDLQLASPNVTMASITQPTFTVRIAPNGNDRWIFDITLTLTFSDGTRFVSGKQGIILDQDNRVYTGAFGS